MTTTLSITYKTTCTYFSENMANYELQSHNIAAFLQHIFKINNRVCKESCTLECEHKIQGKEINSLLQPVQAVITRWFNLENYSSDIIALSNSVGHPIIKYVAQSTEIPEGKLTKLLPDILLILVNPNKICATFETQGQPVTIFDRSRPVYYQPDVTSFRACRNSNITSISEVFENSILQTFDTEMLKTYLQFPSTELSQEFLDRIIINNTLREF